MATNPDCVICEQPFADHQRDGLNCPVTHNIEIPQRDGGILTQVVRISGMFRPKNAYTSVTNVEEVDVSRAIDPPDPACCSCGKFRPCTTDEEGKYPICDPCGKAMSGEPIPFTPGRRHTPDYYRPIRDVERDGDTEVRVRFDADAADILHAYDLAIPHALAEIIVKAIRVSSHIKAGARPEAKIRKDLIEIQEHAQIVSDYLSSVVKEEV